MASIIDRGRGPEIAGTRITVYDVLDYLTAGRHPTYIAAVLGVSSPQVDEAIRYIEEHRDEVMADYQDMVDFAARGNPPEIEARMQETRAKLRARFEERGQPIPPELEDARPSDGS